MLPSVLLPRPLSSKDVLLYCYVARLLFVVYWLYFIHAIHVTRRTCCPCRPADWRIPDRPTVFYCANHDRDRVLTVFFRYEIYLAGSETFFLHFVNYEDSRTKPFRFNVNFVASNFLDSTMKIVQQTSRLRSNPYLCKYVRLANLMGLYRLSGSRSCRVRGEILDLASRSKSRRFLREI